MTALVWLHEDALRQDHPVFSAAGDAGLSCFVWDANYLQEMDYSFKRLVFIYETLCELPLTILHGSTVETLIGLAQQHDCETIYVPATPNPAIKKIISEIQQQIPVAVIDDTPFISLDKEPDIKRFFRYWNKAKKLAMQSSHSGD